MSIKIELYWDNQDQQNEGWAFREMFDGELKNSGAYNGEMEDAAILRYFSYADEIFVDGDENGDYAQVK